jgi:hypothetical protein
MRKPAAVWICVLLLAIGAVSVVRAVATTNTFLPTIYRNNTHTPTATPATRTPTVTPTPRTPAVDILEILWPDTINERVVIKNQTSSRVDLTGWRLKAESGEVYTFPTFSLAAGATVQVWTNFPGENFDLNLYWGREEPVFTSLSSCVYLRDKDSNWIDEYCL